jgi:hypothetical protein
MAYTENGLGHVLGPLEKRNLMRRFLQFKPQKRQLTLRSSDCNLFFGRFLVDSRCGILKQAAIDAGYCVSNQ